jgi:hypothetical protein
VLILGAPHVLQMGFSNGAAVGGPGAKWAALLKSKGGPLTAILGYRGDSPDIGSVGKSIAALMGEKISAGLKDDAWVKTWLLLNAEHSGKDTWSAVGMDTTGYYWIQARSLWSRSFDKLPFISGDKYKIVGPAPMV